MLQKYFPFSFRVILLISLMLVVALWDFYRKGPRATKFSEYGFIIIAGAIGAVVGFINDIITASISPDYFVLGKGLEDGPDLRIHAGLLGLQVGFSAGVTAGAFSLFVSQKKSAYPPLKYSRLLQLLWIPVVGAIFCAISIPLAMARFDPAHFSTTLNSLLNAEKLDRFRKVWWAHVGLYAGMVIGVVLMLFRASKRRKAFGAGTL